jgi:hypothetical protein
MTKPVCRLRSYEDASFLDGPISELRWCPESVGSVAIWTMASRLSTSIVNYLVGSTPGLTGRAMPHIIGDDWSVDMAFLHCSAMHLNEPAS